MITHGAVIETICTKLSDKAARFMLEIAREMTSSPLGTGDGNVIYAQRLLEKRLTVQEFKSSRVQSDSEIPIERSRDVLNLEPLTGGK